MLSKVPSRYYAVRYCQQFIRLNEVKVLPVFETALDRPGESNSMTFLRFVRSKTALFGCTALLFLQAVPAAAEVVDKVVAAVNSDVITLSELNAELDSRYGSLPGGTDSESLARIDEIRAETLESIIDRRLIEQKAAEAGLSVSDLEVDRAFERQIDHSGLTREQFFEKMKQTGASEAFVRSNLKAGILQSKLIGRDVRPRIVITEEMVKKAFNAKYVETLKGKSYTLLQAGFSWGDDSSSGRSRSKKKALEMAEEMRATVLTGKDFRELAVKYSDLPSAADGGDIGTFTLDELAPEMAEAIKDLRPSQVSKIIETSDGYQFFQVISTKANPVIVTARYDDVKDELREKLFQDRLQKEYKKWMKDLKANAYIQKM